MGFFSKFEGKMEDTFEGAAGKMNNAPISPVQIMKKAEKQMRREKMVSAGREFAPTLYTVLVNADDDQRLFGFYPTLAGETETRLESAASSEGLALDCKPLVRFIVDESLKHGKFDVIAEVVSAPIIAQLRDEEMQRYGMAPAGGRGYAQQPQQQPCDSHGRHAAGQVDNGAQGRDRQPVRQIIAQPWEKQVVRSPAQRRGGRDDDEQRQAEIPHLRAVVGHELDEAGDSQRTGKDDVLGEDGQQHVADKLRDAV